MIGNVLNPIAPIGIIKKEIDVICVIGQKTKNTNILTIIKISTK